MDTVYPQPIRLKLGTANRKKRGSQSRYRTQPVTFSEIKVSKLWGRNYGNDWKKGLEILRHVTTLLGFCSGIKCCGRPATCFLFPAYFLRISFIFLRVSFIFLQNSSSKGGEGEEDFEGEGLANFLFTPGIELGIFQVPRRPINLSEFPTPIFTTRTSLR